MNKLPTDGGWCDECYARYQHGCAAPDPDAVPPGGEYTYETLGDIEFDEADCVKFCAWFIDGRSALKYLQMNDVRNHNPYTRSGLSRLLARPAQKDAES